MADSTTDLIVTLSGTHPAGEVAKQLQQHGFQVQNVMNEIGVITGVGNPDEIASLQAVPGVSDVSQSHRIDIGPPGASTTW